MAIYSRLLDHGGRSAALVAAVDVTQSKRAEAEVLRTREFLDTIIENVPTPIVVKDARDFRHILINRAAESFLGVSRADVIGKTASRIYAARKSRRSFSSATASSCRAERNCFTTSIASTRRAAACATPRSKRMPIFDEKGEPLYLLTVIDDLTERTSRQ